MVNRLVCNVMTGRKLFQLQTEMHKPSCWHRLRYRSFSLGTKIIGLMQPKFQVRKDQLRWLCTALNEETKLVIVG